MPAQSSTEYIQETSKLIMEAFCHFGIEAGQVLAYNDLFPFLDGKDSHYRDWMRDAEQVLRDEGYTNPDASGIMLTEVGHKALYNNNS